MAVSRILSPEFLRDDDHLSQSRLRGTAREPRSTVIDRRYSNRDATIPEDRSGPAVLPLFCLAPHGVFRASRITPRAVSSYLAFSPLPALLSKNRRCLFCDTFRQRSPRRGGKNAAHVFYVACCRMVFGLSSSEPFDSPAIICHRRRMYHNKEPRKAGTPDPTLQKKMGAASRRFLIVNFPL